METQTESPNSGEQNKQEAPKTEAPKTEVTKTEAGPKVATEVIAPPEEPAPKVDELAMLKQRATLMGIEFSNNIGLDTLKAKIEAKQNEGKSDEAPQENNALDTQTTDETVSVDGSVTGAPNALTGETPKQKKKSLRQYLYEENMKLVRLRISNMDPKKSDLNGEIITIANEYIGTVKKFVPFTGDAAESWHVPNVIYKYLKKKKYLSIRTIRDPRTGVDVPDEKWVNEFSLEVLPPLTKEELQNLAQAQIAAGTSTVGAPQ